MPKREIYIGEYLKRNIQFVNSRQYKMLYKEKMLRFFEDLVAYEKLRGDL